MIKRIPVYAAVTALVVCAVAVGIVVSTLATVSDEIYKLQRR